MITADSNVFVYLSDDSTPAKQRVAWVITARLRELRCAVALQVVGEVRFVLQRKARRPAEQASELARSLLETYPSFQYSHAAVERALERSALGHLSYWDALLLASAEEAGCTVLLSEDMQDGCTVLLSEDMQDGRRWSGVEIVNPFGADGLSPRARELLGL